MPYRLGSEEYGEMAMLMPPLLRSKQHWGDGGERWGKMGGLGGDRWKDGSQFSSVWFVSDITTGE